MGLGFRLGPVRVGTRSSGISFGPFSAFVSYGRKRRRSSSRRSTTRGSSTRGSSSSIPKEPTKTELREQFITDNVYLFEFDPAWMHGDEELGKLRGAGQYGECARQLLRRW